MRDLRHGHRRAILAPLALTVALLGLAGPSCTYVVTFDDPQCGDGVANGELYSDTTPADSLAEECDGADLRGRTCHEVVGFTHGTLRCGATCRYDTSRCWARDDDRCDFERGETATNSPNDCAFVKVVAGWEHTCGLLADGTVLCWGANGDGQVGTGRLDPELRPARVAGEIVFADLFAGGRHTCGVDTSGTAYCWGFNYHGQLGLGDVGAVDAPTPLLSPSWVATGGASIANTCFVTPESGVALCAGENGEGQLGTGDDSAPSLCSGFPCAREAMLVSGVQDVYRVAVGLHSVCAFRENDDLWCWGWDPGGPLATTTGELTPLPPHLVQEDSAIEDLVFGQTFVCAREQWTTYCWGDNQKGQLGDPTFAEPSSSGRTVALPTASGAIALGDEFACATANESNVYCWGDNLYGQLGRGQLGGTSAEPLPVPGFTNAERLAAGANHVCAIKFDGTLWCWGQNFAGQLGDGTTQDGIATPVQVIPGPAE